MFIWTYNILYNILDYNICTCIICKNSIQTWNHRYFSNPVDRFCLLVLGCAPLKDTIQVFYVTSKGESHTQLYPRTMWILSQLPTTDSEPFARHLVGNWSSPLAHLLITTSEYSANMLFVGIHFARRWFSNPTNLQEGAEPYPSKLIKIPITINIHKPLKPTTFIFSGYNPQFQRLKPCKIFHGFWGVLLAVGHVGFRPRRGWRPPSLMEPVAQSHDR